ncbi:hypothetical protein C8Q80DRAFT_1261614 [Daedaleopsis nitida]|nr:hypothetical protein C8Q80DRAFT_1261614 [Daedaleopsis nitida]
MSLRRSEAIANTEQQDRAESKTAPASGSNPPKPEQQPPTPMVGMGGSLRQQENGRDSRTIKTVRRINRRADHHSRLAPLPEMSTTTNTPSQDLDDGPDRNSGRRESLHPPPGADADRALKKPRLLERENRDDGEDHQMEDEEQQEQLPPPPPQQQQQQQQPQPQQAPPPAGQQPPQQMGQNAVQAFGPQPGAANIQTMPSEDLPDPLTRQNFNPNTMPYVASFDDVTLAAVARGENPHLLSTRSGGAIELPLQPHPTFPDLEFVHTHFPGHRALANVDLDQAEAARAAGNHALAIIVHGGGQEMYRKKPEVADAVQAYMRGFAFQSNNNQGFNVKVYIPIPNRVDHGKPFAPPYALIAILPQNADALRTFLLQQEILRISPTLSFTASPVDNRQASWKTLVLTGDAIIPGATHNFIVNQKRELLQAIRQTLAGRETVSIFENFTTQLVRANWGLTGTRKAIVDAALDTFTLELSSAEDTHGVVVPAYILLAKPPAYEQTELDAWRTIVAGRKTLWLGMDRFSINAAHVDCKLCKSDIHRTGECPIATKEGWTGITPEALAVPDIAQGRAGRGSGGSSGGDALDLSMRELFRTISTTTHKSTSGLGGQSSRGGSRGAVAPAVGVAAVADAEAAEVAARVPARGHRTEPAPADATATRMTLLDISRGIYQRMHVCRCELKRVHPTLCRLRAISRVVRKTRVRAQSTRNPSATGPIYS